MKEGNRQRERGGGLIYTLISPRASSRAEFSWTFSDTTAGIQDASSNELQDAKLTFFVLSFQVVVMCSNGSQLINGGNHLTPAF